MPRFFAGVLSLLVISGISGNGRAQNLDVPAFEVGQVWECGSTYRDEQTSSELQFLITGVESARDISERKNFQNGNRIVSVALFDVDSEKCHAAKSLRHTAFFATSLARCDPSLVELDFDKASPETWASLQSARDKWLVLMRLDQGSVMAVHPSSYWMRWRKQRCGQIILK